MSGTHRGRGQARRVLLCLAQGACVLAPDPAAAPAARNDGDDGDDGDDGNDGDDDDDDDDDGDGDGDGDGD
eukprot:918966-Rhodomonas_salina.3